MEHTWIKNKENAKNVIKLVTNVMDQMKINVECAQLA